MMPGAGAVILRPSDDKKPTSQGWQNGKVDSELLVASLKSNPVQK